MNITLTPRGEELLRTALDRHPDRSPADIVEQALADRLAREQALSPADRRRKGEEIRAWLDELAQFSDKIPPIPGETFTRDMIYQNHD
jgi:hypothetical protein